LRLLLLIIASRGALQEQLDAAELGRRSRLDRTGADPPGGMDLVPAVLGVVDPRADDLDPRALLRDGDPRAVLRDDLDDEVAADAIVPVGEQLFIRRVEMKIDVDVAVVLLEFHLVDGSDRDAAAALHDQSLRVVDAGQRPAPEAVR